MNKKVLVLCTGNSCRSIMAEALINAKVEGVEAKSSGVRASGKVNQNAKKLLEEKGIWKEEYHSKTMDDVMDETFDLVVTVCDHAHETCPMFPKPIPKIHVGFSDPDGKGYEAFEQTYEEIEKTLLPKIKEFFGLHIKQEVKQLHNGVKISFSGAISKDKVERMMQNCTAGKCECMKDETKKKIHTMQVIEENELIKLELTGDIKKEEIEEALSRSKLIN